jgi:hypothetical protein
MWQKCPVCNGTGKNKGALEGGIYNSNCPTCNGHRIISELTGKPPAYEIKTNVASTGVSPCIGYEPSSDTSSATTCKWCGKEKWLHPTHISSGSAVYHGTIAASDSLNVSNTKYDLCVMCGKETIYEKSCPVAARVGYVEGAGQLCSSCYKY